MSVLNSLLSAFLMYSRIPVPQVAWKEENRRWTLCFFPLIGVVIGGLFLGWYLFCDWLAVGEGLFAAVAAAIPIAVTGGIHFDGFCDVCDARACCGTREKMLAVMSDSHIGAFAVIKGALYLLVQAGVFSQIYRERSVTLAAVAAMSFMLSRALSGLAAVTFRSAKREGSLQQFTVHAHRTVTVAAEVGMAAFVGIVMLWLCPVAGIGALAGAAGVFVYYRMMSYKVFGGITGDLAGYFLQLCELASAGFAVLAYVLGRTLA